jgi:hypothetical protein
MFMSIEDNVPHALQSFNCNSRRRLDGYAYAIFVPSLGNSHHLWYEESKETFVT